MTRTSLAIVLGLIAACQPLSTAAAQDITVTAPRPRERDPATGATIETVTISRVVKVDDLDLKTPSGMSTMQRRIHAAAVRACSALDDNRVLIDDTAGCIKDAEARAVAGAYAMLEKRRRR